MSAFGHRLYLLAIVMVALTGGLARAQDLDRGKSGAQLFATNCVACHHSPNGLAQDSFSWTLSSFLQQHYTDSPASAQVLTAYLQSIDARRAKPQPAVHNSLTARSSPSVAPRPPASVPVR
jgi:mono/diheme cytochrome c family protein